MKLSIVIAAHNEGPLLWKTVASCVETYGDRECEFVVCDDASTDDSLAEMQRRFPLVKVVSSPPDRRGPSPTKDLAARHASGEILVFLDAHCKPEPNALSLLVEGVERTRGQAIIVPATATLDPVTWENQLEGVGFGYQLELANLSWQWLKPDQLQRRGTFYESPSLIGCCLALTRELYEGLGGFDPDMRQWGVEDVELGVKSWLLGHPVLCEPLAIVGHRFQQGFAFYTVQDEHIMANRLRMACKIFGPKVWPMWLERFRSLAAARVWERAWEIFSSRRLSAEWERNYLLHHRVLDEYTYSLKFGLPLPPNR